MQNCYGFIFSVQGGGQGLWKGQLLGVVAARLLDYRSVQEGLGDILLCVLSQQPAILQPGLGSLSAVWWGRETRE